MTDGIAIVPYAQEVETTAQPSPHSNDLDGDTDDLLTATEASAYVHAHPETIKRWAKEGRLDFETTSGGHRRYRRSQLERVIAGHSPTAREPNRKIIDLDEAADLFRVSKRLLRDQAAAGELGDAARKIGGGWRFDEDKLLAHYFGD